MAFEDHKNPKTQFGNPFADYEYYGKHSRRTWPSLFFSVLIGLGLCYLAWVRWHQINMAEIMGGTISLTSIEWLLYKISGKWGIAAVLTLLGIGLMYLGFSNFRRMEKMKKATYKLD
jgi:uncharacterized membrane protein YidH (DUF202 family)